ncbi:MAG: hypothetical protein J6B64_02140 [Bacilli bacterium]|nr:hypothetical protein [Bacilli bacterium]
MTLKEEFIKLEYTEEDYEIIRNNYAVNQIKDETLIKKLKDNFAFLLKIGYTKEEVIKMTKSFPPIYGLSIENMKQKIEFYDSIDMHELAVINPKQLMQSVNLSYARYSFYKDRGIDIDMNNYRKLFVGQKDFEKAYGITKKELLEKYDYDKYEEQRKMKL